MSYISTWDCLLIERISKQELELREEGGTAAVVETIRAGLVMQLKETVGVSSIMHRAEKITK